MSITVLKSKIHRATVTCADLNYEGSISIDEDLMDAANIREYEKVLIANVENGNRYETYVIKAKPGSGEIAVNGAGARYSVPGDKLIIMSFMNVPNDEVEIHPIIITLDKSNKRLLK